MYLRYLKESLNASKTSAHLPNQGEKMQKRLGENIDYKDKTSVSQVFGIDYDVSDVENTT